MQISAKTWNEYVTRLSRLNQKAGQLMRDYIDAHGTADTDGLVAYAYGLVTKYSEGSAELACQMYEALAEVQGVYVPAAEPAETASYGEVARMVHATKDQNPANLPNGVSRLVKRAGADTTLKNAVRDGAEWAWVPHGDTCPFCITLASNGWQKASQKLLKGGHAEHIHANCDCEFAVRFRSDTTVAGYDPDKYYRQYREAGGDINKMRRIDYAARKDAINAQKRAAYAARKEQAVLQKLNFADNVPQTERESIVKELSVIPQWQRDKAESIIDKVVLTSAEATGSGYEYRTRTLYVHPDHISGDMIHEYGHALEISLDLIHNEKYLNVRASGIDLSDLSKIDDDNETFTEQAWILNNSKFISRYQGRMYEHVGIMEDGKIVLDSLMEYFSEGYRAYFQTPDFLKEKDPALYEFIGGLKDDN
nr:MAG TPA: minor capsid protein 2 [Caudoviricetes sp.]